MNLNFINAVAIVRNYLIKVQVENDAMANESSKANAEMLLDFNEDVRMSSLYENISKSAHLEEVQQFALDTPYITSVIRTGSVILMLSLGFEGYQTLIKEMAQAYALTSTSTIQSAHVAVVDSASLLNIYQSNAWLVFCLIARYADFTTGAIEIEGEE